MRSVLSDQGAESWGAEDRRSCQRAKHHTVHLGHCGAVVTSIRGSVYLLVVLDSFSGFMLVYGLRRKSAALSGFKLAITDLAKYNHGNIEVVRVDMGTKWTNDEFRTFCANANIRIEYTAPDTPQQNAPVESAIWRLMKGGTVCRRSAAAQFGIPDFSVIPGVDPRGDRLWLESVRYIAECFNRCGTKANPGNISPHEAFTGKKPDAIVVPFFQPAMMRVVRATKLDDQSVKAYFLNHGYQHGRSTVRLLKASTGRVCFSRDIVWISGAAAASSAGEGGVGVFPATMQQPFFGPVTPPTTSAPPPPAPSPQPALLGLGLGL